MKRQTHYGFSYAICTWCRRARVGMGKYQGRKALLYGGLLGTLPDLDVFIRYADPISSMTYHRGFSHSLCPHSIGVFYHMADL